MVLSCRNTYTALEYPTVKHIAKNYQTTALYLRADDDGPQEFWI